MKINAHILLSVLFWMHCAKAASDPYTEFALHIARIAEQQNVNVSTWSGGFTGGEPPGGQVFRGFYDFDSDGHKDLILLSSVNVPYASFYKNNGTNDFLKITDDAVLFSFHFAVSKRGDLTQVVSIAYENYFARVAVNLLSVNGGLTVSLSDFDGEEANSIDLAQYGAPEKAWRPQKITMIELLLAKNPNWTEAPPNLRIQGQGFELPDSLENAQHNFTPTFVISMLQKLEGERSNVALGKISAGSAGVSTKMAVPASSENPKPGLRNYLPISMIVEVGIVLAVFLWLIIVLLRHKSP